MITWPDPARPGVPLNPEKDGWHWLEDTVDGVGTGHIEAAYYAVWDVPIWYRAGNRAPITKPKQWRYLGPVLTPDEAAALRDDLASSERERAHQHGRADRNAAEYAREQAKREALQKRVAELQAARIAKLEAALQLIVEYFDEPYLHYTDIMSKARDALEGKKDE